MDYISLETTLDEGVTRVLIKQLFEGLNFCHKHYIYHRDIKPDNLPLDSTRTILKIIDFGLSTSAKEGEYLHKSVGTPNYCAPEVMITHRYLGHTADTWSAGCTFYSMLFGHGPFRAVSVGFLKKLIESEKWNFPANPVVSDETKALLRGIIVVDTNVRFTIPQILSSPWFDDISNDPKENNTNESRVVQPSTVVDIVTLSGVFDMYHLFGHVKKAKSNGKPLRLRRRPIVCQGTRAKLIKRIQTVATKKHCRSEVFLMKQIKIKKGIHKCVCNIHHFDEETNIISFEIETGYHVPYSRADEKFCKKMQNAVSKALKRLAKA